MEPFTWIKSRRSVRSYLDRDIDEAVVSRILEAAMTAPSAGNQQPWQFIVVRDRDKLEAIAHFHPYCKMAGNAPLAIVVCGDPDGKKWPDFWIQDCSAAIQTLLLAARAEGIGTVWTGVYPLEDRIAGCRALFEIPKNIIPLAIIPMGYPKDDHAFKKMDRFKPDLVHQDVFGG